MYFDLSGLDGELNYCEMVIAISDDGKPFYVFRFVEEPFDKIIFELYDLRLQDGILHSSIRIHTNPDNYKFSNECEFSKKINILLEDLLNHVQSQFGEVGKKNKGD